MHSSWVKTTTADSSAALSNPTLAALMQRYGDAYRSAHTLPSSHLKIMQAISRCRTADMGGHLHQCDACGYQHPVYNSCGNRHCPQCQSMAQAAWVKARIAELLPVPYFHTVFTLPHHLNPIVRYNKKLMYNILFSSVSKTLLAFGANPANGLGGTIGCIAVLHTWDQQLREHIHLHCVIPAGAISSDAHRWIHPPHAQFLFPVHALSAVFKGKFMDEFKKAFHHNTLAFVGHCKEFQSHAAFQSLAETLYKTNWVIYAKKPFAGPQQVLMYLSRYTHKIAISNHRVTNIQNGSVTFSFKDRNSSTVSSSMSCLIPSPASDTSASSLHEIEMNISPRQKNCWEALRNLLPMILHTLPKNLCVHLPVTILPNAHDANPVRCVS